MTKIQSFRDLDVWKEGHLLVLTVYKITKTFPKDELFALTSQLRRAVVSITSNLAEGFGRLTYKDKSHFYQIALGSIMEVQNQLIVAKDIHYISEKDFKDLYNQAIKVEFICKGLIKNQEVLILNRYSSFINLLQ